MSKTVEKKILPEYLNKVSAQKKTFEIRKDEDDIQPGDILILRGWDGEKYTGKKTVREVTYVLRNVPQYGLQEGYCIIAMQPRGWNWVRPSGEDVQPKSGSWIKIPGSEYSLPVLTVEKRQFTGTITTIVRSAERDFSRKSLNWYFAETLKTPVNTGILRPRKLIGLFK